MGWGECVLCERGRGVHVFPGGWVWVCVGVGGGGVQMNVSMN